MRASSPSGDRLTAVQGTLEAAPSPQDVAPTQGAPRRLLAASPTLDNLRNKHSRGRTSALGRIDALGSSYFRQQGSAEAERFKSPRGCLAARYQPFQGHRRSRESVVCASFRRSSPSDPFPFPFPSSSGQRQRDARCWPGARHSDRAERPGKGDQGAKRERAKQSRALVPLKGLVEPG